MRASCARTSGGRRPRPRGPDQRALQRVTPRSGRGSRVHPAIWSRWPSHAVPEHQRTAAHSRRCKARARTGGTPVADLVGDHAPRLGQIEVSGTHNRLARWLDRGDPIDPERAQPGFGVGHQVTRQGLRGDASGCTTRVLGSRCGDVAEGHLVPWTDACGLRRGARRGDRGRLVHPLGSTMTADGGRLRVGAERLGRGAPACGAQPSPRVWRPRTGRRPGQRPGLRRP